MARKSLKGGEFERDLCRQLSLWFSEGEADDLFWRSSQSGGRATTRAKRGLKTRGHCGDMAATDPMGEPLLRVMTIEAKRGYNDYNIANMMDRPGHGESGNINEFIIQSIKASKRAGTPHWLLIHRRDGCKALVFVPNKLLIVIKNARGCFAIPTPYARVKSVDLGGPVHVMLLDDFLKLVHPTAIKTIARRL